MDIYLDIWSCNIRHLHVCVNWICLLKSIKDNKNTNTCETKWIKKKKKKTLYKVRHIRNIISK